MKTMPVLSPKDVRQLHALSRRLGEFVQRIGEAPAPRRAPKRKPKPKATAAAVYAAGPTRRRRLPADDTAAGA